MSIISEINRITGEVSEQSSLIAQIKTALEGKALGGGGQGGYTGDLYSFGTATVQPGSGATQVSFNNIPREPDYFILYVDTFDVNQYHRAGVVVYDGEKIFGHEYYSGTTECNYFENTNGAASYHWRYSYSGTTLTISSSSTSQGGYFHNPGTYTLRYAYKDNENGTVAIDKIIFDPFDELTGCTINGLRGEPLWFAATALESQDAQQYAAEWGDVSVAVFATENGFGKLSQSPKYEFLPYDDYAVSKVNDGYRLAVVFGNSTFVASGEYSLIYAYVPPTGGGGTQLPTLTNPGTAEDLAAGKQLIDGSGNVVTGSMVKMAVKTGTTTSNVINTGLSDIEQFFIYKESQTATGLIHLHYTKTATSRMYASAWSTNNYGTKTITNGTGGASVSGGTITISATNAAQGGLTSGVTYKWIAVGIE